MGGRQRNWRAAAVGLAFGLATTAPASAHPHVWVTVKSQIAFTPDGKVSAVVHDWVFDEMYSSFATQGLAPPGQLVNKEQFAPLAKENAGSLAEIGYFTTLKIGGKAMDFGTVTDYWMQERPDHLVEFHVTLPLKTPTPVDQVPHPARRRPGIFHRLRIRRQGAGQAGLRARGLRGHRRQAEAARGERQAETDEIVLHQPRAGNQFRFQNGERRHRRVPMTKRALVSDHLGCAAWSASASRPRWRNSPRRPFAVAGGEGGGGAEGGVTGWLMAQQSWLTHLIAAKVHALHGQPSAAWGLVGLGLAYGVVHAAGPGHGKAVLASYMLANETSLKRGAVMALMAALLQALIAIALVGAAGFVFSATASQMNHAADWIDLASYCSIAAIGAWLVWRKGASAHRGFRAEHADRRRAVASAPAYAGVAWRRARVQPFGRGLSRRAARRRGRAWRTHADMRTRPTRRSSMDRFHGAPRLER